MGTNYTNTTRRCKQQRTKSCWTAATKAVRFLRTVKCSVRYKIINSTTRIEILDGGNGANTPNVLETFELYGCFVQNAAYNTLSYSANEPVTVTLAIRYDNAIQTPDGSGIGTAVGRTTNTLITGGGV